jgi:hypothetical protein
MAKLNGLFKYEGTFQGVTTVNSLAYGQHIRKARTKFTLSKEMKESSAVMKQANVYAKVFKDAIDPYRRDFRDGMLWQRLVSLFKKQLQEKGKADFRSLEGHELHKSHPLSWILNAQATVTTTDNVLSVHISSRHTQGPIKGRVDGYQLTLIVLFVDRALLVQTFSGSTIISIGDGPGEQQASWTIPEAATTAILVLKCDFSSGNKPMSIQKAMGMRVVKVVEME